MAKKSGYWSKDRVIEAARRHTSREEFRRVDCYAYKLATINGWMDEACAHMKRKWAPRWTDKAAVLNAAAQCSTRSEFKKQFGAAVQAAQRYGWYEEACVHMKEIQKPDGHWTKPKILEVATQFDSKMKFIDAYSGAATIARRNGWWDEVCSHMSPQRSIIKRAIYVFEFNDGTAYVGLSWNPAARHDQHVQEKSATGKKIIEGVPYKFSVVTEFLDSTSAVVAEAHWAQKMIDQGWTLLNIRKTGSLGSSIESWTPELIMKVAKEFRKRTNFARFSYAYHAAKKLGILEEACAHMDELQKPHGYWNKERVAAEAKKYKTRTDFMNGNSAAYSKAKDMNWVDDVCTHMTSSQKPRGYWTYENCMTEAKRWVSRSQFERGANGAWAASIKYGLAGEIPHASGFSYKIKYWSRSAVLKEISEKCIYGRTDWYNKSKNSYAYAAKHSLIEDIAKELGWNERNSWSMEMMYEDIRLKNISSLKQWREIGKFSYVYAQKKGLVKHVENELGWTPFRKENWSFDELIKSAEPFSSISEWRENNSRAYAYAKKYKFVINVADHLGWKKTKKWSKEECVNFIKLNRIKSATEFSKGCSGGYDFAKRNGILEEIYQECNFQLKQMK